MIEGKKKIYASLLCNSRKVGLSEDSPWENKFPWSSLLGQDGPQDTLESSHTSTWNPTWKLTGNEFRSPVPAPRQSSLGCCMRRKAGVLHWCLHQPSPRSPVLVLRQWATALAGRQAHQQGESWYRDLSRISDSVSLMLTLSSSAAPPFSLTLQLALCMHSSCLHAQLPPMVGKRSSGSTQCWSLEGFCLVLVFLNKS